MLAMLDIPDVIYLVIYGIVTIRIIMSNYTYVAQNFVVVMLAAIYSAIILHTIIELCDTIIAIFIIATTIIVVHKIGRTRNGSRWVVWTRTERDDEYLYI